MIAPDDVEKVLWRIRATGRTRATELDLAAFETKEGVVLHDALRQWLRMSNGGTALEPHWHGVNQGNNLADASFVWRLKPGWRAQQWFPVAGDGSGNYYLTPLAPDDQGLHPVFFFNVLESIEKPTFVAASDLWHFVYARLATEYKLEMEGWPFDKHVTIRFDPDLLRVGGVLPWNA